MNSSIFNFSSWHTLAGLWPWRGVLFSLGCVLWFAFPFFGMDALDVPVWLVPALVWLAGLYVIFPAYRRLLVVLVFTVSAGLVVMESVFRVRYFGWPALNVAQYRPAGYPHPWSLFEHAPDTYTGVKAGEYIFKGHPFRVNRDGFRGPDRPYKKPEGTIRVVVTGTSVGMGAGVAEEDMFTTRMEMQLNDTIQDRAVEVINISVGGNTVGNMLHDLDIVGRRFQPDVALLSFTATRLTSGEALTREPFRMKALDESQWGLVMKRRYEFFSNRSFVLALVVRERRNLMHKLRGGDGARGRRFRKIDAFMAERADEAERLVVQALTEFRALAESMEARPVVYLIKPVMRLNDPEHHKGYRSIIKFHADRLDIPVLDAYRAVYPPVRVQRLMAYPGDSHPNALMHRVMGDYFAVGLAPVIEDL